MAERQFPYLPEGREPGIQSRRDARERSLFPREWLPEVEDVWIAVDRTELRRGEAVTATVSGRPLREGAEVGLVCGVCYSVEQGSGDTQSLENKQAAIYDDYRPAGPDAETFRVPEDAAYSYEGTMLSFSWRVVVVEQVGDEKHVSFEPIWVTP